MRAILVGADIANVASSLLMNSIDKLTQIIRETEELMDELEVSSLQDVKGSLSLQSYVEPTAFERASYIKLLQSYGRI